jgi:hypothetical protein
LLELVLALASGVVAKPEAFFNLPLLLEEVTAEFKFLVTLAGRLARTISPAVTAITINGSSIILFE